MKDYIGEELLSLNKNGIRFAAVSMHHHIVVHQKKLSKNVEQVNVKTGLIRNSRTVLHGEE